MSPNFHLSHFHPTTPPDKKTEHAEHFGITVNRRVTITVASIRYVRTIEKNTKELTSAYIGVFDW